MISEGFPKTISSFSDEILLNRNCGGSQTEAKGQVLVLFLFTKVFFFRFKSAELSKEIGFVMGLFASCNSGLKVISVNRVVLAHGVSDQLQWLPVCTKHNVKVSVFAFFLP